MSRNRIQFHPGLSMPVSLARVGSDVQCESALARTDDATP